MLQDNYHASPYPTFLPKLRSYSTLIFLCDSGYQMLAFYLNLSSGFCRPISVFCTLPNHTPSANIAVIEALTDKADLGLPIRDEVEILNYESTGLTHLQLSYTHTRPPAPQALPRFGIAQDTHCPRRAQLNSQIGLIDTSAIHPGGLPASHRHEQQKMNLTIPIRRTGVAALRCSSKSSRSIHIRLSTRLSPATTSALHTQTHRPQTQQQSPSIFHVSNRYSSHSPLSANSPATQRKPVTLQTLASLYRKNEPITMITAHDFPSAHVADQAGMDMVLVGDSLAMVALGYEDTSEVTVEDMLVHCRSVARGAKGAFKVRH